MILFNICYIILIFSFVNSATTNTAKEFFKTKRLIRIHPTEEPKWKNQTEIFQLMRRRQNYLDITEVNNQIQKSNKVADNKFTVPSSLNHQNLTRQIHDHLDVKRFKGFLQKLSEFHTRFFLTDTGVQAGKFLKSHLQSLIKNYKGKIQFEEVDHLWNQSSYIVSIKGTQHPEQIVVLGAHYDSINQDDPLSGRSPGADDNGTGVITTLEILQTMIQLQFKPKRTIEFHFYAAEEAGLLGSLSIAFRYLLENRQVVGMLGLDMIGYKGSTSNNISITTDNVDPDLSKLLKLCYEAYSKYSTVEGECGFPCSDHVSWTLAGFRSAYPSEKEGARGYHTDKDVLEDVDFDFLLQSAKSSVGFLIELSEA